MPPGAPVPCPRPTKERVVDSHFVASAKLMWRLTSTSQPIIGVKNINVRLAKRCALRRIGPGWDHALARINNSSVGKYTSFVCQATSPQISAARRGFLDDDTSPKPIPSAPGSSPRLSVKPCQYGSAKGVLTVRPHSKLAPKMAETKLKDDRRRITVPNTTASVVSVAARAMRLKSKSPPRKNIAPPKPLATMPALCTQSPKVSIF